MIVFYKHTLNNRMYRLLKTNVFMNVLKYYVILSA